MTTQHYTVSYYRITCDRCGAIGPKGDIEHDAIEAAKEQDWQRFTFAKLARGVTMRLLYFVGRAYRQFSPKNQERPTPQAAHRTIRDPQTTEGETTRQRLFG